jgi:hypothetical protein
VRFRPGHLALLLFQAIWLNVIVPGHVRGMITVPGSQPRPTTPAPASSGGCCAGSHSPGSSGGERGEPTKPPQRAVLCAICQFAARLTPPPVVDLTPPQLELLETLPAIDPAVVASIALLPTYDGRAPPVG